MIFPGAGRPGPATARNLPGPWLSGSTFLGAAGGARLSSLHPGFCWAGCQRSGGITPVDVANEDRALWDAPGVEYHDGKDRAASEQGEGDSRLPNAPYDLLGLAPGQSARAFFLFLFRD